MRPLGRRLRPAVPGDPQATEAPAVEERPAVVNDLVKAHAAISEAIWQIDFTLSRLAGRDRGHLIAVAVDGLLDARNALRPPRRSSEEGAR